jgi:carbamoyl-phosphate synthase small subunit
VDEFSHAQGIPGVCGVDTRGITRIIRENGVMNAKITSCPDSVDFSEIKSYKITGSVEAVSSKDEKIFPAVLEKKYSVVLLDYGAKKNIVNELRKRGCEVRLMPYDTPAERILSLGVDGVMLSNGPGDPADNKTCIKEIGTLLGKLPVFGICLGHQLLALAAGGKTEKLKYGHRGVNQPVKNLETGRVYISSQNHGYTVMPDGLEALGGHISYINANDGTVEGVEYPDINAFSVQFHPEACSGPKDSVFLFDTFIRRMGGHK